MTISDLKELISKMDPQLSEETYYIASVDESQLLNLSSFLSYIKDVFREKEGLSIVFSEKIKDHVSVMTEKKVAGPFALITMNVNSDLMAVGFLAKMTEALAKEGISVNAFSAYHHDHLLVPFDKKEKSLEVLRTLSSAPHK